MVKENKNNRGRKPKVRDYNSVFAQRFRKLIEDAKITLPELAQHIGTTRQSIGQWKDGNTIPDISALKRIAEYFNVTSDYLLGLSDVASIDTDVQAVCEYTGLSEKAAKEMHMFVEAEDMKIGDRHFNFENISVEFINAFLEMSDLFEISKAFRQYTRQIELCKFIRQKYSDFDVNNKKREYIINNKIEVIKPELPSKSAIINLIRDTYAEQRDMQFLARYKIQRSFEDFISKYTKRKSNSVISSKQFTGLLQDEKEFFDSIDKMLKEGDT